MCNYAVRVLEDDRGIERTPAVFGRSFLKRSLSARLLREKVVDQAFLSFSQCKDWQAMVDVFIVKHHIKVSAQYLQYGFAGDTFTGKAPRGMKT
jgi:hypothetical protein